MFKQQVVKTFEVTPDDIKKLIADKIGVSVEELKMDFIISEQQDDNDYDIWHTEFRGVKVVQELNL